jgi:hypothetical protein
MKDEILEEVWRAKDALSAKYNHNIATMFADFRQREKTSGLHYVDFSKPAGRAAKRKSSAPKPRAKS